MSKSEDWTTIAARRAVGVIMSRTARQTIEEVTQNVAIAIRTVHETEGREDCTRRVEARDDALKDVGVQDQARQRLLARMAGNIAAGHVSGCFATGKAAVIGNMGSADDIAGAAVEIAEAILKRLEKKP